MKILEIKKFSNMVSKKSLSHPHTHSRTLQFIASDHSFSLSQPPPSSPGQLHFDQKNILSPSLGSLTKPPLHRMTVKSNGETSSFDVA
jgi:hypothetical protein